MPWVVALTSRAGFPVVSVSAAAALALLGGRAGRRAALRGLGSAGAALAVARAAGSLIRVVSAGPGRSPRRAGAGLLAAAVGLTVGAGLELPLAAVPLAGASAVVGWARVSRGMAGAIDVVGGVALGAVLALGSPRLWPVAPKAGADLRLVRTSARRTPSPRGEGLAVVVNPGAGSATDDLVDELRQGLPEARVVELAEGEVLVAVLEKLAPEVVALGVAGGDGSINAAAGVAHAHDLPLVVIPGGTLNHFARDLGLESLDEVITAVQSGEVVAVDLATIAGQPFLNTASVGSYPELVDTRERLEDRIGKWPAMIVALARVLRRSEPLDIDLDGHRRRIWMIFIGNCRYHPSGFAPRWRERLDDGELDIRLVDATQPWSRARLVMAVLTGLLGRCRVYEQRRTRQLRVRSPRGPQRLARDGETFDGPTEFLVTKDSRPLHVYAPTA